MNLAQTAAGKERCIVSNMRGTTRDAIDTDITLPDGQSFKLIDTAGIRRRSAVAGAAQSPWHDKCHPSGPKSSYCVSHVRIPQPAVDLLAVLQGLLMGQRGCQWTGPFVLSAAPTLSAWSSMQWMA